MLQLLIACAVVAAFGFILYYKGKAEPETKVIKESDADVAEINVSDAENVDAEIKESDAEDEVKSKVDQLNAEIKEASDKYTNLRDKMYRVYQRKEDEQLHKFITRISTRISGKYYNKFNNRVIRLSKYKQDLDMLCAKKIDLINDTGRHDLQ